MLSIYFINQYNFKKQISSSNNQFIIDGYNLDNKFLITNKNLYLKKLKLKLNKSVLTSKKKILILGDSMSLDMLNILTNSEFINKSFDVSHYYLGSKCLQKGNFSSDYNCEDDNKDQLSNINLILQKKPDIIVINYLYNAPWNKNILQNINSFIKKNKNLENKFVIVSDRYRFPFNLNYSILDQLVLKNKSLPSKNELKDIEKMYYLYKSSDTDSINSSLKMLTDNEQVLFLPLSSMQCDIKNKTCKVLDILNYKIYLDNVSHLSLTSTTFFGKKVTNFFMETF